MDPLPGSQTRLTLLGRLRSTPKDPCAWAEFVEWYGQKIYVWCRSWGLQEADAQDVTQDVFLKLSGACKIFVTILRAAFGLGSRRSLIMRGRITCPRSANPGKAAAAIWPWNDFP